MQGGPWGHSNRDELGRGGGGLQRMGLEHRGHVGDGGVLGGGVLRDVGLHGGGQGQLLVQPV